MTAPTLALCGKAASRFAGPAFGCPAAFGLVLAAPEGGASAAWDGPAPLMYQTLRQIARIGIRTEDAPAAAADDVVVRRLHADIVRVLGRALALRHVDAGSCNACELESQA